RPRRHTMLCERVARRTAPRGGRLGRARGVDAWRPGACRAKARVGQNWRNDALTGGDIRTLTCPTQPRAPAVLPPSGPRTVAAQERLGASAARAKPTKRTSRGVAGAGPRLAAAPGGAGAPRLRRRGGGVRRTMGRTLKRPRCRVRSPRTRSGQEEPSLRRSRN
ncbi:unnamed protein product, partial [Prorocentrum cordatum]